MAAPARSIIAGLPDQAQALLSQLDKELAKYPLLIQLERRTKVPKSYAAAGVVSVIAILIFFNIWGQLFTNLLGFLYPAYASFKALESSDKADDAQWLTYWTVFGFVNVLEFFSDILLYWLPLYYTMKAAFILWLVLPQTKGAEMLYKQVFRPVLLAEHKNIDNIASKIKEKITEAATEITNEMKKDK